MASPNIDRFPIKVRHINRHKQNVRIYILCHNELRLKYTMAKFGSFYWAVPILMKYTDCTFDNAFWKQLLEIKDEWINCTMVGVISSKVAMNLDLNAVNSVIQEPTQWTDGFYNFKCTDVIDSPNTVIIVNHVYNVLYMPIPTQSNINCWMCRPTLMEQFIQWFEDTLKPTVMMHRLIITDPTYRENLIKQKALKLCGTPLHPLASSVIDRLTKVFFDGLNNPYSTQEQNFSKFPTLFHKYNLQLSRPETPIQYEVIQSTCKDDKPICHLHIHDIQNVQQYTDYMNMICEEYYIIVTFNTGTIQTIDTNITYIKVPNKGFDIGPKICAIHFLKMTGLAYEYILFLHSKSDIEIRKKLYDPLVKNAFRIKLLSHLMKIQPLLLGIFPDWCFSESVRRSSYDPYISNIACTAELLRYIGIYKFDKIFAAGNCMILRKNVIDRIFSNNLDVFYNSLNELTSFDYNWFKVKHRLGHELSVKQVYDKYVSMNTAGNNLACMHTSESLPDAMIEHAFERIWLNVISDMKGEYLILTEDNIVKMYDIKLNAIYFPQFHEIVENNEFWGDGFTEWTLLKPYKDTVNDLCIYKPHADIGYYDLGVKATLLKQIEMAKTYGINGFIVYHYWFNKHKVLMTKPLEYFLDETIQFPFAISWANESWTRRWDGGDNGILIEQTYDDHLDHIQYLIPFLQMPNYMRNAAGDCIVYIYNIAFIPNYADMISIWTMELKRHNLTIKIIGTNNSFSENHLSSLPNDRFLFEPMNVGPLIKHVKCNNAYIFDYKDIHTQYLKYKGHGYHFGLPLSWNNCVRKPDFCAFKNFNMENLEELLLILIAHNVLKYTNILDICTLPSHENIININAWNEWNEQAILEPNNVTGYQTLETIRDIVQSL